MSNRDGSDRPQRADLESAIDVFEAKVGSVFTLRAFPTSRFRIARRRSFISGHDMHVVIEVEHGDFWLDFTRDLVEEVAREARRLPSEVSA